MSAVLASQLDPGAITVIKGNKPLSLRYSRKHRAVLYASEPEYIDWGLQIGDCGFEDVSTTTSSNFQIYNPKNPHSEIQNPKSSGWRELEIPPLTMLTFRHETLMEWQSQPFRFVCQERRKADL